MWFHRGQIFWMNYGSFFQKNPRKSVLAGWLFTNRMNWLSWPEKIEFLCFEPKITGLRGSNQDWHDLFFILGLNESSLSFGVLAQAAALSVAYRGQHFTVERCGAWPGTSDHTQRRGVAAAWCCRRHDESLQAEWWAHRVVVVWEGGRWYEDHLESRNSSPVLQVPWKH